MNMNAKQTFNLYIPTKLLFGCGELKKLATEPMPGKKAMIVISGGTSMKKYGYLDKVVGYLKENHIESVVFDKILANPIKQHVMEAAAICRDEQCDFVVGLGGGSSIDSAKSIAVMACNTGDYWDYVVGGTGKGKPVEKALPIVAIPTTAGTGTEADPWTVITHETAHEKIGFGCPLTFPAISIVDPELMVSIPPRFTAYQASTPSSMPLRATSPTAPRPSATCMPSRPSDSSTSTCPPPWPTDTTWRQGPTWHGPAHWPAWWSRHPAALPSTRWSMP